MNTSNIKDIGVEKPETINYLNYKPSSYSPEDTNQRSFKSPLFRDWFVKILDFAKDLLLGIYIFMLECLACFLCWCGEVVEFSLNKLKKKRKE